MTMTTLMASTLRLLVDSWRGQVAMLAVGALLLGPTLAGVTNGDNVRLRTGIALLELMILLAASMRASVTRHEDIFGKRLVEELRAVGTLVPRLLAQTGLAAAPMIVAIVLAMQLGSLHPLLGLVAVPLAFVVVSLAAGPVLLAMVAVVHGEQRWMPRSAFRSVRASMWTVALEVFTGAVITALTALPLMLVGFVVTATGQALGMLGAGIGVAAIVPWMGCWSVALWRSLGSNVDCASGRVAEAPMIADGPAWNVVVEPGAVWGTWIRLEASAQAAFRVEWDGLQVPELLLCAEHGAWMSPGVLAASGDALPVLLPAGNTYVQVGARGAVAQAISVTMLLHSAASAAAA